VKNFEPSISMGDAPVVAGAPTLNISNNYGQKTIKQNVPRGFKAMPLLRSVQSQGSISAMSPCRA